VTFDINVPGVSCQPPRLGKQKRTKSCCRNTAQLRSDVRVSPADLMRALSIRRRSPPLAPAIDATGLRLFWACFVCFVHIDAAFALLVAPPLLRYLLAYLPTHPSRYDSRWPAFAPFSNHEPQTEARRARASTPRIGGVYRAPLRIAPCQSRPGARAAGFVAQHRRLPKRARDPLSGSNLHPPSTLWPTDARPRCSLRLRLVSADATMEMTSASTSSAPAIASSNCDLVLLPVAQSPGSALRLPLSARLIWPFPQQVQGSPPASAQQPECSGIRA
jgi:hypothetical protein